MFFRNFDNRLTFVLILAPRGLLLLLTTSQFAALFALLLSAIPAILLRQGGALGPRPLGAPSNTAC
jgi:hypothetical protein